MLIDVHNSPALYVDVKVNEYDEAVITDIDSALLLKMAAGDREAFANVYDRWSGKILVLIVSILVDYAQSEEVLQEVFLEVWQRASSFDPDRGSARAFLVTLARRRAIDRVRSSQAARNREERQLPEPDYDQTLSEVEERIVASDVRAVLNEVGEPHKSTIELAFLTGYKYSEIAQMQGIPLGTVKTRIRDGLAKMRKLMEGER